MTTPSAPVCKYFVKRKKRNCRMTVRTGSEYCGEHQPPTNKESTESATSSNKDTLRIECPYDNTHTCYAHKLQKHLKICNARPMIPEDHISPGINAIDDDFHQTDALPKPKDLYSVPIDDISMVIHRIRETYKNISSQLTELCLKNSLVEDEMSNPSYGDRTKKHLIQVSSMLGIVEKYNLLQENTSFIEFGAGKGQLSYWMSKFTAPIKGVSVVLIDRASLRHKLDNKLDKTQNNVHRIRADISDVVLGQLDILKKRIVGLAKHLCGDATDLAMRCLVNYKNAGGVVDGLLMSFCCHHRCTWPIYCGKSFFTESGLSQKDFDVMCGIVSWAVCGTGFSRRNKHDGDGEVTQNMNEPGYVAKSHNFGTNPIIRDKLSLSREEKEEIGRQAKMIINWGRMKYLTEHLGLNLALHYYVRRDVTLENVCIVGFR